jgi:hypothetical protein
MEENGKRRLTCAIIAAVGLVYFFVCARPLPKELVLEPTWSRAIPPDAAAQKAAPWKEGRDLQSFRFRDSFGYFDKAGEAILALPQPFGAAVSDSAYILYDRLPESFSIKAPGGKELAKFSDTGYPFFGGDRLFMVHPGQSSVSELSSEGKRLWTHDFPSIITVFDSSPGLALFGLMDGSLVGLDKAGNEVLDFSPGGSRIAGIYGCAVSPDGELVAAISGFDRQRLVVLEKRSSAYRVTWHRYLAEGFRRPVSMAFTRDGKYLVFEQAGSLGIYDRAGRREESLVARNPSSLGLYSPARGILLALESSVLSDGSPERKLLCASPEGKRLFSLPFVADDASLGFSDDAVFLGMEAGDGSRSLARLDFKEE